MWYSAINLIVTRECTRVTIDGREAKVTRVGPGDSRVYQARVSHGRMNPGRSYWVKIKAKTTPEAYLIRHERLYLHRSFTPDR